MKSLKYIRPMHTLDNYHKTIDFLNQCRTRHGFVASVSEKDNYFRIFARDSAIVGLAASMSKDHTLLKGVKKSLATLARYQGAHGEIPSNVAPTQKLVSYGQTTGRVDATLWFVIGLIQYVKRTNDHAFLGTHIETLQKCLFVLGAWEFNQKGFIFVPPTGDWADEYINYGYVLYDQVLYYQALRDFAWGLKTLGKNHTRYQKKAATLKQAIQTNFWISKTRANNPLIYHPVLFKRGKNHVGVQQYFVPYFSPWGYGTHFDTLANTLVSLTGIATKAQQKSIDTYITKQFSKKSTRLLPAFHPVITPTEHNWEKLRNAFSYSFKNKPHEYHNGGLWPMVTGFYAADLAGRNKKRAAAYLDALHAANRQGNWGFYEFHHSLTNAERGTKHLCWSAATAIIAHHALYDNTRVFL